MRIMGLPVDDGGCGNYRVRQPLELIRMHSEHDTHVIDPVKDDMTLVSKAFPNTDVVIVRQGGEVGVPKLRSLFPHLKFVLDIDDNMEIISPYSEHYGEYGTESVQHHGQWLWKDGEKNFDIKRNRAKIDSLISFMGEADMVTTTTEKLAEYARAYSKNVWVLPNFVDLSRWWRLPFRSNSQLRVGWSGGISHYEDWYSIKKPLNKLMKKYQFKLVMVGSNFEGIVDPENRHLVEVHDWVPFRGHSYRMMCMNLDFAIIPLADLPFNHYKSSIKLYEMSAMGVPSVVANVLPYKEDISLDKSLFWSYNSPEQFKSCVLGALVKSSERLDKANRAYDWALSTKGAEENINLWIDAYRSLL